jgi:hypothetical protein
LFPGRDEALAKQAGVAVSGKSTSLLARVLALFRTDQPAAAKPVFPILIRVAELTEHMERLRKQTGDPVALPAEAPG